MDLSLQLLQYRKRNGNMRAAIAHSSNVGSKSHRHCEIAWGENGFPGAMWSFGSDSTISA